MIALLAWTVLSQAEAIPTDGQTITKSVVFRPGTFRLEKGLKVQGRGVVLDFKGATLESGKDFTFQRELLTGDGILVEESAKVVIKNLKVRGYRFNIRILNSEGVILENCDVSFSRAIRMREKGTPIDTFLDLRNSNSWREYGAGIWIEKSKGCVAQNCRGSGGTIGLALVDSNDCTVRGCDFSFCGGWGVSMARSDRNIIAWNMLDFGNRTWAGGWGGDAACLGMADDCDYNFIVRNSMTHGGDGFFLSNSNDVGPVDSKTGHFTPKGGSDHNVIAYNDGSWAPANAFEGTFSEGNIYFRNIASDSGYGFWLGFSNHSWLIENMIEGNRVSGIAIEHGRGTRIENNGLFSMGDSAIHLWASPAKERVPFPSTLIDLIGNHIADCRWAYRLEGSTDVSRSGDTISKSEVPAFAWSERETASALGEFQELPEFEKLQRILDSKPAGFKRYRELPYPQGLEWLQADDYGPRDFRGDLAALREVDPGTLELFLIDPKAKVETVGNGAEVRRLSDRVLRLSAKQGGDYGEEKQVVLLLTGKAPSSGKGSLGVRSATIRTMLRTTEWDMKWFSWKGMAYEDSSAWRKLFAGPALKEERNRALGGDWSGRSPHPGVVPADHFALLATTKFRFAGGKYTFNAISDDGFRLLIDGKPVIERWNHHGPTPDKAMVELSEGVHELRVEYCQEGGAAVLRLDWRRAVP